jgi:hypothetical protein
VFNIDDIRYGCFILTNKLFLVIDFYGVIWKLLKNCPLMQALLCSSLLLLYNLKCEKCKMYYQFTSKGLQIEMTINVIDATSTS